MTIAIPYEPKKNLLIGLIFFSLIILAYWVYMPGMNGVFIFDDTNNLSPIGKYGQLSYWDNFWLFLLEGNSGPTGRPVSLASFYLNDIAWPSTPSGFIYTNILIHLLNGILLFWFSFKLSSKLPLSQNQQVSFSLLTTALWLLHPLHTSTVLYVIQRMTELSATFILTGLLCYLYGREKLSNNKVSGLILLFVGVGLSLLLSVLSKENGILLVAYILVVEFFLLQPFKNRPPKAFYYWLAPVVILPFICILIYLGIKTNPDSFSHRNFTLAERLLTEPRILFEYIYHILIPNMSSSSLFHDDFILSKNLLTPWTTLTSILGIVLLTILAFIARRKQPVIAFAIAWFFAGHLIESTVLPLELYFEHRNYLPMLGILIVIAWVITQLVETRRKLANTLSISLVLLFSLLVMQNAILWGKPLELITNWHKAHPNSQRTTEMYIGTYHKFNIKLPFKVAPSNNNQSSLFISQTVLAELSRKCSANKATLQTLDSAINKLKNSVIHSSAAYGLVDFLTNWEKGDCEALTSKNIEDFLINLSVLESTKNENSFASHVHYWLSTIYQYKRDFSNTMTNLDKAYEYYPDSELLKLRVAYLASAGLYDEALSTLDDTSRLEKGFRARWALKIKQKEFSQLKETITSRDMRKKGDEKGDATLGDAIL